jgi:hypothetical protein
MRHALLLLTVSLFPARLFSQQMVFANQFGGGDTQVAQSIAADSAENIFASLVFYDEIDVDPGPAEMKFESAGSADIALVKLTSSGDLMWAIHLSSNLFEGSQQVATDMEGNVYLCGYFKGTIDFDPGPGEAEITPSGEQDAFLAKYDGNGNFLWVRNVSSSGYEEFYGLATDESGHIYSTGYFQNTVDFDPGPGTINLTAIGGNGLFFWKLDQNGNYVWAKHIAHAFAGGFLLDTNDALWVTGNFFGTIDFNPGSGTFNLSATGFGYDAFLLKMNMDGIFQWAGAFNGSAGEQGQCLAEGDNGEIIVGGNFEGTADVDPSNATFNLSSSGGWDSYVSAYDASGVFLWAKSFGGAGFDAVYSLEKDFHGNLHLAGVFEQSPDFDPSNNSVTLTTNGLTDCFFSTWDTAQNFVSVFQVGGVLDDWMQQMVLDEEDGLLTCGHFSSVTDFDPSPEEYLLTSYTGWDGFIAKYCTAYTIENFVSVCAGDSIFAGGNWQTEAGDYYDYFIPSFGCDSTVITHLSVSQPAADLGDDTSFCENDFLLLDAGGLWATYLWNTGDTAQTIEVNEAGSFSVMVTDAAGCTRNDTIEVFQLPLPFVELGNDTALCGGDSLLLDAGNAGAAFLWSTGDSSQSIYTGDEESYSVMVTDLAGCSNHDTIDVSKNPLPIVNLGADQEICEGDSVLLDAGNAGSSYGWSTGENGQEIYAGENGAYWVNVTDGNGCHSSDTLLLTLHPLPEVSIIGGDTVVCLSSASLPLPAAFPGGGFYTGNGVSDDSFNPGIAGLGSHLILYTYTDSFGCTGSDSFLMEVVVCTGTEKNWQQEMKIYPNPSEGIFTVEFAQPLQGELLLFNQKGTILFKRNGLNESKLALDLTHIPPGLYYLRSGNDRAKILIGK